MSGLETQNRRRSAVSSSMVTILPQADGSVDAADSAHVLGVYCGFWEKVLVLLRLPGRILRRAVASVVLRRVRITAAKLQVPKAAAGLQIAKLAAAVQTAQPAAAVQTAQPAAAVQTAQPLP